MKLANQHCSLDHDALLETLVSDPHFLLIQDLDGVCMGLVADPLTRHLDPDYLRAAAGLSDRFFVLTNGEHIGRRGVNGLVERAFGGSVPPQHYLPGLAGGGVQWQDRAGVVDHPGVSDAELAFLEALPARAETFLTERLAALDLAVPPAAAIASAVLDNPVSPTINLNGLHAVLADRAETYRALQQDVVAWMTAQLDEAAARGLDGSFFVHLAPNLGHDGDGHERLRPGDADQAGTTDVQFMLRGAVKEVGVLVLLNHWYAARTGQAPLGDDFNARTAPAGQAALLDLAAERFDPALMPRLIGVGDTVSSLPAPDGAQRGGSDRGFLTLVQGLGARFATDNAVLFVDSSGGEVRRPGLDAEALSTRPPGAALPWRALAGISDPDDPLQLNFVFPGGHRQYVDFFTTLAQRLR